MDVPHSVQTNAWLLFKNSNGTKELYSFRGKRAELENTYAHGTFNEVQAEFRREPGKYTGYVAITSSGPQYIDHDGAKSKTAATLTKPVAPTAPAMVSGFGQAHTNEADPDDPAKKLTPYVGITFAQIQALVDSPQQVEKKAAQWCIPSTLPSRKFKKQEDEGQFHMLWLDLDESPPPIDRVAELLDGITSGSDCEIYTSRSATEACPKSRTLIPLAKPLSGAEWVMCQELLNDLLASRGVVADRASQRPAQLCYLPNRDGFYQSHSQRDGVLLDPLAQWGEHIVKRREALAATEAAIAASRAQAQARRAMLTTSNGSGKRSVIDAFTEAYPVEEILLQAGYVQRGDTFRHPRSQSGSFSASVKNGRVHALSSSDPLFSDGQGAHDAFSAFAILNHGGNQNAAMKDAGENWLTIGGESWNKVAQREYMQAKATQEMVEVDVSGIQANGDGKTNLIVSPPTQLPRPIVANTASFTFVSAGDLVREPKPVEYLIDDLIEHESLMMLFGAPSAGKSFASISMSASVATSTPWLGRDVRQGTVFYIAGEGHAGIARRLKAWEIETGVSLVNAPLFVSRLPAALMHIENAVMVEQAIEQLCATHGAPALIVIDTLARNMGSGDESSNADIGQFVAHIDAIRHRLGCTVQLVHHSGHMETNRARGASALPAAMDTSFQIEVKGKIRTLTQRKAKESELVDPIPLRLKEVSIGWKDAKGREMNSAVLVNVDTQEAVILKQRKLTPLQNEGLQSLCRAITEHSLRKIDGDWIGIDTETWRSEFYRTCASDDKKKAFQRVRADLKNRGLIRIDFYICYVRQSEPAMQAHWITSQIDKAGQGTWPGQSGTNVPVTPPA